MFVRNSCSIFPIRPGLRQNPSFVALAHLLLVTWSFAVVVDGARGQGTVPSLMQNFSADMFAQMPRCSDPHWRQEFDVYREQLQQTARYIESVSDNTVKLRGEGIALSYDHASLSLLYRAEQAALKFARGANVGIDSVARYRDDLEALDSAFKEVSRSINASGGLVNRGEATMALLVISYSMSIRNKAFKCQEERGVSRNDTTERLDSSSRQVDLPSADVSRLVGRFRRSDARNRESRAEQSDEPESPIFGDSESGDSSSVGDLVGQFKPKRNPSDSESIGSVADNTLATASTPEGRIAAERDRAADENSKTNFSASEEAFEWVSDREVNRVKACVTGGRAKDSAGNVKSNPLDGSPLITFVWTCSERVELRWRCKGIQYADGEWEGTTSNRMPDGGYFRGSGGWNHSSCKPEPDYSGIEYAVCPSEMLQSIVWYGNGQYGCRRYRHRPK